MSEQDRIAGEQAKNLAVETDRFMGRGLGQGIGIAGPQRRLLGADPNHRAKDLGG